ncbi:MAG: hypothetical protein LBU89_07095 [Fibromonadaceae bacterium]|jgi:hypothetical protein|nr:hypothetical protein [Fibromonadaceae bacterium]
MRQDIKSLSSKIDAAVQLCKNVLEYGEKIRGLSPLEIGMEEYAEELTLHTESRGRATRIAIQEINEINGFYETIENDPNVLDSEKAFLTEKLRTVQDLSPLFAKQSVMITREIEIHLNSLRKESVEFRHNVGVIKNYLKAPDKRSFYG